MNSKGISVEDLKIAYIELLINFIGNIDNNTEDFRKPYIRKSLRYVYPIYIFLHAIVLFLGVVGNVGMIYTIFKKKLYKDATFFLIGNLALSDIIKCTTALPLTVANLLLQNWIFGSFLCFFLPMLQYFPIHASMLTFLVIAVDRYRQIVNTITSRVPAGLFTIAVWVVAIGVALPYAIFIKYFNLEDILGEQFKGVGLCWVNVERNIEEYLRAMFVTLYAVPLAIIGFLYVKVSAEIKSRENSFTVVNFESPSDEHHLSGFGSNRKQSNSRVTWSSEIDPEESSNTEEVSHIRSFNERATRNMYDDDNFDPLKEKRTQKYMISMVTLFAICWCPLNILNLITHFVYENNGNSVYFDITYFTFTFIGFVSVCINPILFASWRLSRPAKDRLRGYFRFSNRSRCSSHPNPHNNTFVSNQAHSRPFLPKDNNIYPDLISKSYV